MKTKQIKKVLSAKIEAWLNTIKDKDLRKLMADNIIVSGGAIASFLMQEDANDYDIYFRSYAVTKAVTEYYVNLFEKNMDAGYDILIKEEDDCQLPAGKRVSVQITSSGVADSQINKKTSGKYVPVCISSNAITLTDDIQIVIRFYGNNDEIHKNFDFAHCTCSYFYSTNELILPTQALTSLLTKELKYTGSRYPLASIIRTRKFIKRGFTINAGEYLKMILQVGELDLQDVGVLEDQLTGVDSLYFQSVIEAIRNFKTKNPDENFSIKYVGEVIDRVFGDS